MHVLTDNQGRPLNGTNSFGEPITYAVTRFRNDGTLALMAVYVDAQGEEQSYPLSTNLAAYGYHTMPSHTFVTSTYKAAIQPLINQEYLRVEGTVEYGTFNTVALDVMILMSDIEHLADNNGSE
ncbi:MAG: hypothetical protein ACTILK_07045 [Bifidobacterium crudilactis]|uniref:hypothetical protein n=1 Tax=Bifidobacterium crudilactis TaxID=327277 RepID=UPI003F977BB5